ncbi:CUE domain protein, putative [Talaromyces stipitatus ATCC 10500]|uniref:CUE domain protein, putative n=1 Tax=Talaromyces stipitatus (strain ATCC 10500 / CBS 375.48 / QM 6759 / NRRL 1006) TaxID=441959 RepID=B8M393_TALSN|nr:CUE domain protein, putative [Talaromyces stipitatus ATCC 10500]EED22265.1 CUE domain protein, putative [Talaromyces stipitatus ATCC 10500]
MTDKLPRKRRKLFFDSYADFDLQKKSLEHETVQPATQNKSDDKAEYDDEPTDVKLARLISLFPDIDESILLDVLVSYEGCVEAASACLEARRDSKREDASSPPGMQSSLLSSFQSAAPDQAIVSSSSGWSKPLTKRGKTLHLYSPEDIARHTPCSIIHNFLGPEEANELLTELLDEAKTFHSDTFQLFDKIVQSPHTSKLYVSSDYELRQQTEQYVYNGTYQTDVRKLSPRMKVVSDKVQKVVNEQVQRRIQTHYPDGKKLRYQSPREWVPNVALVNCYDGPQESVGYHSDQQTYLGPRAIIGSLSLGVAREFRVRKVAARDGAGDDDNKQQQDEDSVKKTRLPDKIADAQGQISIHLPHNSLLIMHAEMQEEWKHSIPAVSNISPHPVSGNKRINITYRWYRESLHPRNIPRCRCNMPTILRCVQRKQSSRGRYMWMCYAGYAPGSKGCSFFQWAEFDDDGEPLWEKMRMKRSYHTTNDQL